MFVPKKNTDNGITLNFGNPKSFLVLLAMLSFSGFVVFMILRHQSQLIVK